MPSGKTRLLLSASAPLPAVAIGVSLFRMHDVSLIVCATQLAALVIGMASFLGFSRMAPQRMAAVVPRAALVALALTAATLIGPSMEGVHRWLPIGPLKLNASELFAPLALAGAAVLAARAPLGALAFLLAFQGLHCAQPDAGQATAFAIGTLAMILTWPFEGATGPNAARSPRERAIVAALAIGTLGLAVFAWQRPDPLGPVAHVEGIVGLAASHGTVAKIGAIVALALAALAPLWLLPNTLSRSPARAATLSVTGYSIGAAVVPWFGHYPVPLLGFGASPILGLYLALGALAALAH